jgi:hypothetical protein
MSWERARQDINIEQDVRCVRSASSLLVRDKKKIEFDKDYLTIVVCYISEMAAVSEYAYSLPHETALSVAAHFTPALWLCRWMPWITL